MLKKVRPRKITLIASCMIFMIFSQVQADNAGVSINTDQSTPNANSILDVKNPTTGDGKGMLIPRMTEAQRTTANASLAGGLLDDSGKFRGGVAAQGLLVYQTDGTQGFYYNSSTTTTPSWVYIGSSSGTVTSITANAPLSGGTITDTGTIAIAKANATTDGYLSKTDWTTFNSKSNLALGETNTTAYRGDRGKAAYDDRLKWDGGSTGLTAATGRTSLGLGTIATQAANNVNIDGGAIDGATIGANSAAAGTFTNVAAGNTNKYSIGTTQVLSKGANQLTGNLVVGDGGGSMSGAGQNNTFVGLSAGTGNTTGANNCALGSDALKSNTTGTNNIAAGYQALYSLNGGHHNTAFGQQSMYNITTGVANTSIGYRSLYTNSTGNNNISIGINALNVYTGNENTAVGNESLNKATTGGKNTAVGYKALKSIISGTSSTAVGHSALEGQRGDHNTAVGFEAMWGATSTTSYLGAYNTAVGSTAMRLNQTGANNAALGYHALTYNTTGSYNTAIGYEAMYLNVSGANNTAIGQKALRNNKDSNNTAVGFQALQNNTSGTSNTAIGYDSMMANTTGDYNTALGYSSLNLNSSGTNNAALGYQALAKNTTGKENVAVGRLTLFDNSTGNYNSAVGYKCLTNSTVSNNTGLGFQAGDTIITGTDNVCVGYDADVAASSDTNSIVIGSGAVGQGSNSIMLGNSSINNLYCYDTGISSPSDRTLKENIEEVNLGLDFISQLQPVKYNYKKDKNKTVRSGLIAQDVKKAMNGREFAGMRKMGNGKLALSYTDFIMPLINAVKELKTENEKLKAKVEEYDQLKQELNAIKDKLGIEE